jgi:rod shape-determining protein MreC
MTGITGFVQKHRSGVTFAFLLLLCLSLILFSNRNVVLEPRKVGQSFVSLFQVAIHGVGSWFSNTWNSIGELQKLRAELDEARQQLAEYERVSRDLTELRRQNEELRQQLGFSQALPLQHIPAEVIARDPGNDFSTIMINRGRLQGVQEGMPVVAFQGGLQGLVGRVIVAAMTTATVQPITDPEHMVATRLQGSRYDGLVAGDPAAPGSLLMSYVKKLALDQVQYGELVVTSGLGQLFPEGIYVGRVREITARGYEASLELQVQPIVDFSRLEYVFVLVRGSGE